MKILDLIAKRRDNQERLENTRHRNALDQISNDYKIIEDAINEYTRTRVAVVSEQLRFALQRFCLEYRQIFSDLAAEMGRRLILITETERLDIWHMSIKGSKRMENLISHLLLIAEEGSFSRDRYYTREELFSHPIRYSGGGRGNWNIWFCGSSGKPHMDAFIKRCTDDPVFQVIIGE